ncbi:MAG: Asp-tRNA(Asn)/Glu-tRNA(Gln) amidotransferase GatCAB subunit A, partial [Acidobacteria bacterium]|nr:Asp-tRNA(Asn)/Glu-tRNA(Gln) amidotransferase GatCAB subunit A [Acidobacteriota bacterium]
MSSPLYEMSLADISTLIHAKQVSPVEVTAQALERITQLNPRLNAFLTITDDLAKEQARAAEAEILAGHYRGPLHGVPVAVKDLFYTRGVRTTAGSKILANFVPDFDATVVEKLHQAGAVLVGKTALHEFAYGVTNDNPHFGPTRNPWNPQRTSGGSSGGSGVAVASGMVFAALGSDTGGSIRIPASFCGVTGLKPTFGGVSLHGVFPLGYTLDHVGPLARTVEDAALVYRAIAGFDPQDSFAVDRPVGEISLTTSLAKQGRDEPGSPAPSEAMGWREGAVKVGVPEDYFFDFLEPEIERAVRQALRVLED